ncbi:G2E3 ligase, partial [Ramphastos sulfuratus]|nr:G2E3 ligase [Ramphastos sulfuratus]
QQCCVCGSSGAAITCWELSCKQSFHLPCVQRLSTSCLAHPFALPHRAFCSCHRPQQAVDSDPEPHTKCLLCVYLLDDTKSYTTMVCPVCQRAWFHRHCIPRHALRAGILTFKCMLCRDKEVFQHEMLRMGIRVPTR